MAIRILSGIIFARGARSGTVTIAFDPHEARSTEPGQVAEMESVGPSGRFAGTPCKHVAVRQFSVIADPGLISGDRTFNIDDQIDRDSLTIDWSTEGNGFIREISYLVIGETE
jgi:hypothetical protein